MSIISYIFYYLLKSTTYLASLSKTYLILIPRHILPNKSKLNMYSKTEIKLPVTVIMLYYIFIKYITCCRHFEHQYMIKKKLKQNS